MGSGLSCRCKCTFESKISNHSYSFYSCAKHEHIYLYKIPTKRVNSIPRGLMTYTVTLHKRYTSSNNNNTTTHDAEEPMKNVDNW